MTVNTGHHQIVRKLPEDFIVSARSDGDDAVEAIEYTGGHNRYALGVQWHPEDMDSAPYPGDIRIIYTGLYTGNGIITTVKCDKIKNTNIMDGTRPDINQRI